MGVGLRSLSSRYVLAVLDRGAGCPRSWFCGALMMDGRVRSLQAVLGVLIKNYILELPHGPDTKIESCRGVLPRPRVAGEKGACVPMRVRRVD